MWGGGEKKRKKIVILYLKLLMSVNMSQNVRHTSYSCEFWKNCLNVHVYYLHQDRYLNIEV
jgi:hypothetical protein